MSDVADSFAIGFPGDSSKPAQGGRFRIGIDKHGNRHFLNVLLQCYQEGLKSLEKLKLMLMGIPSSIRGEYFELLNCFDEAIHETKKFLAKRKANLKATFTNLEKLRKILEDIQTSTPDVSAEKKGQRIGFRKEVSNLTKWFKNQEKEETTTKLIEKFNNFRTKSNHFVEAVEKIPKKTSQEFSKPEICSILGSIVAGLSFVIAGAILIATGTVVVVGAGLLAVGAAAPALAGLYVGCRLTTGVKNDVFNLELEKIKQDIADKSKSSVRVNSDLRFDEYDWDALELQVQSDATEPSELESEIQTLEKNYNEISSALENLSKTRESNRELMK